MSSPGLAFTSPSIQPGGTYEYLATKAGNFAFFQVGPPRTVRGSLQVLRVGSVTLETPAKTVRYGDAIALTGTTSLPAFPVIVQARPTGVSAWQEVMTVTPDAEGSFSALVQPEKATVYRAGTLDYQLVSTVVRIVVRPRLTVGTPARATKVGRRIVVTARVVPPDAARAVDLMHYNRKWRAWRRVATRQVSAENGFVRFPWRVESGANVLRAHVFFRNLAAGYAESTSAAITVKGIAPKKARRRR